MHNKVVFHTMKALNAFGFPVLRFNFRGTGLSAGEHDHGRGEREDVRAALDWLDSEFHRPIIFAGFSFGAGVGLRVACSESRVDTLISLGTPMHIEERTYDYRFLQDCAKPKLFVSGSRDQFGPRFEMERMVASVPEPRELVLIPDAGHFFEGHLPQLRTTIEAWINKTIVKEG